MIDETRAAPGASPPPAPLRRGVLILVALASAGTVAELVLTEHWGDGLQLVPFAMAAVVLAYAVALLRAGSATVRGVRPAMAAVMLSGVAGAVLHARGNRAFELEVHPDAAAAAQLVAAITGVAPLLAPGILGLLAALVWLAAASGAAPGRDARARRPRRFLGPPRPFG